MKDPGKTLFLIVVIGVILTGLVVWRASLDETQEINDITEDIENDFQIGPQEN